MGRRGEERRGEEKIKRCRIALAEDIKLAEKAGALNNRMDIKSE